MKMITTIMLMLIASLAFASHGNLRCLDETDTNGPVIREVR